MTPAELEIDTENARNEVCLTVLNWMKHTPPNCRACQLCKRGKPTTPPNIRDCVMTRGEAKIHELYKERSVILLLKEADPELMAGDIEKAQKQGFIIASPLLWARDDGMFRLIMRKGGGAIK